LFCGILAYPRVAGHSRPSGYIECRRAQIRTSRKPRLLFRFQGLVLFRYAARRFCASLFQLPPRLTRFVPPRFLGIPTRSFASRGLRLPTRDAPIRVAARCVIPPPFPTHIRMKKLHTAKPCSCPRRSERFFSTRLRSLCERRRVSKNFLHCPKTSLPFRSLRSGHLAGSAGLFLIITRKPKAENVAPALGVDAVPIGRAQVPR
jgi:hypothetical protein